MSGKTSVTGNDGKKSSSEGSSSTNNNDWGFGVQTNSGLPSQPFHPVSDFGFNGCSQRSPCQHGQGIERYYFLGSGFTFVGGILSKDMFFVVNPSLEIVCLLEFFCGRPHPFTYKKTNKEEFLIQFLIQFLFAIFLAV